MVARCLVPGCNNAGQYAMPKDSMQISLWMKAMRLERQVTKMKRRSICGLHFKETDYMDSEIDPLHIKRRRLKKHAVPSIFPWNQKATSPKKIEFIPLQDLNSLSESESDKENLDPMDPLIGSMRSCTSVSEKQSSSPSTDLETDIEIVIPFNVSGIKKTYSKQCIPIKFVPELPYLGTEAVTTDPLFVEKSVEDNEYFAESDMDIGNSSEIMEMVNVKEEDIIADNENDMNQTQNTMPIASTNYICQSCGQSQIPSYSVHSFKREANAVHFYTGLETFDKLMFVFHSLGNSVNNLNYFYGKPPDHLDPLEQFCMTLLILRRHREFEDIAMSYKTSIKQVSNIFITWIRFMALQWRSIDLWIDRDLVKYYMPLDFNDKYPNTRAIIDATECPIKKPLLPSIQQITFSSYKNRNTVKLLVGIAPSGLITYILPCYGGSTTDRQIIERSSILNRFQNNDEIMVDKGLNVQDIFLSYGVKVNMPTFFKKGIQIYPDTLAKDRKIASKRVHVERIIGMIRPTKF